jgi:hypothetical protein
MKLRTSWRSVVRFWDQLFECCEFGLVGRFRRRKPAPRKPMFRRPDLTFDMLERREVPASTVAFFPANYMPGESAGSVTITVIRTSGSDAFNVDYTTNNGSATAGNDFTATNGTLSFGASDNSKTFQVAILQDSLDESSTEQFTVTLSESDPNLTIDNPGGTATVQISDDDPTPTVGLSASAYSVNEAAGTLTVPVVLSAASGQTVTVSYSTTPSTASDGSDYTGVPMIPATYVTFNPGQTSQNIVFSITNDGSNEYDEQFSVQFGAMATNATVGTGFAWITIQDDDSSWTPSTEPIGTSEPNFTFGSSGQYDAMSGAAYTSIVLDTGGGIGGGIEGGISGGGECGCGDTLGLLGGGLGGIGGGFELPPPPMGGSSAIVEYFPTILAYNTDAFDVKPIISGTIASAGGAGVPTSIDVRLTWNGSVGSWQNLSTSGLSAGDDYAIAAQVSTAVTSTGYYPFIL